MKIIYNIAGLYRPAGMERVLANKAGWLAANGHEVLVVTTEQKGRPLAFPLASGVRTVDLGIGYEDGNGGPFILKLLRYPLKRLRHRARLARLLKAERADITVSMFCGEERFLTRIKDGSRKVLEVHFSRFKRLEYGRGGLWGLSDRLRSRADFRIAGRFDRFVVLTEEDRGYWTGLANIEVIPNARTFTFDNPASLDSKTVLAVGRYSRQKQFEKLLEAWNLIAKECPGWTLRLVGDGEERDFLERWIRTYGLTDRVVLGRAGTDMKDIYADASVLVLSSRYEGLPMVLLEAQAAGLPVVSFACKCGPRDVITDGVDGFLVEPDDSVALADRLFELIRDGELRKRMGAAAYEASGRFDESRIMNRWMNLFECLADGR